MPHSPSLLAADRDTTGGGRIHAANLAEAFRAHAGLIEASAGLDYGRAYLEIADNLDTAYREVPELATELDIDAEHLLALLLHQREDAYRRYAEAAAADPKGDRARRARRALDALDQAASRAALIRDRQEREAKEPARKGNKPPGEQAGTAVVPDENNLRPEAVKVARSAGENLRRGAYDPATFNTDGNIRQQAQTATIDQLAAAEDELLARKGRRGPEADVRIDAKVDEIRQARAAKRTMRDQAERYAARNYNVDAKDLEARGPYADGMSRDSADSAAARHHVDEAVRSENAALGDRESVKTAGVIQPPLRAGRPPRREKGAGPRSREERIAAQTATAVERQNAMRKRQFAASENPSASSGG